METSNGILGEINDVIHDIYKEYTESKLPKFLKEKKFNKRYDKLRSIVEIYRNQKEIPVSLLYEYFTLIVFEFPPKGKYRHTNMIKSNDIESGYGAAFAFEIVQCGQAYNIAVYIGYTLNNKMTIDYILYVENEQRFSFSEQFADTIYAPDEHHELSEMFNVQIESFIIREQFIKHISDDIASFIEYKMDFYDKRRNLE